MTHILLLTKVNGFTTSIWLKLLQDEIKQISVYDIEKRLFKNTNYLC